MSASDWFAMVALVLSSGSLFIQIRSWWVSVPRLFLSTMSEAQAVPDDGKGLRAVLIVTNRGRAPTMITHMIIYTYSNLWKKVINKPSSTSLVKSPDAPHKVEVNEYWMSYVLYNDQLREKLETERVYIGVYASHSDKKHLVRLVPEKKKVPIEESDNAIM